MAPDPWLQRWLPLVQQRAGDGLVGEIGCGPGDDTATLAGAGLRVHAFDLSPDAVEATRRRVPAAMVECSDLRQPLPVAFQALPVIVASLSLHYFAWDETQAIVQRIHGALRPGGLLLCRLNSTQDHHHGATGHEPIEPGLFRVDGQSKRFFDAPAIDALFGAGWRRLSLAHFVTSKYLKPKALWEVVLERVEV